MNPPDLDIQVSRRLTRYYILALTAVALLSLSGQVLIQYSLGDVLDDARVINLAGRQRMLSQRLTKRAVLLSYPGIYPAGTTAYAHDFNHLLALWKTCHEGLKAGLVPQAEGPLVVRISAETAALFRQLDPHFRAMYGSLEKIGRGQSRGDTLGYAAALRTVLQHEQTFLEEMNAIVFQYDRETRQRVDRVRNIEFMLAVVTFVVLFLEGLFVFRPVVAHTGEVIQRLTRSEAQERVANDQLQFTNQSLRQTQEALLRTAEEKHQLQQAEAKIRSASLLTGQEEERGRLARELHDGIGQMLTGLKLHVEKLNGAAFTEKQQRTYDELRRLVNQTIDDTRTVAHNLMPSVLSDFGVAAALRLLAEQTARSSGVRVQLRADETLRLPAPVETGLYRIAQEALNNAVKHAGASLVTLEVERKNGSVTLAIEDDGQGFDPRSTRRKNPRSLSGNGLHNMRTRAELLNGSLKISSETGKGTRVFAKLPV